MMADKLKTAANRATPGPGRRVLLLSVNECADPYPVFPLGLAHLDAALQQAGFLTDWLDFRFQRGELRQRLAQWRPDFIGISLRNIDDVLIQRRATFHDGLAELCREIRAVKPCPIILGGSGFSIFPSELLAASTADFGLQGEAEHTLPRLLEALTAGKDWRAIPGLVYRHNGAVLMNPPSGAALLGHLPLPVRPDVATQYYLQNSSMLNVQTQRGCAFDCIFCTYPVIEGRRVRRRPAAEVVEDLERVQAAGARYFFVVDSVFNASNDHVAAVCEEMLRKNLGLKWGCFLRPAGLTRDLARLMARAGLAHVEFGTDSFCDSVLAEYGKNFTFNSVLRSSAWLKEAGIDYCHFLICGGPGETLATLEEGFQNSLQLPGGVILPLIGMRIYPGTPLFERAVREGKIAPDADLLRPHYYLADGLTEAQVAAALVDFGRRSPAWIVNEAPPAYLQLVERLRQKGVVGPMWSFYSWLRQFDAAGKSGI